MTDKIARIRDISVDLETLSTRNTASIVSIGAAQFCRVTYQIERTFYAVVRDPRAYGHVEESTVLWWQMQSAEARAVFDDPTAEPLHEVLLTFSRWVRDGLDEDDRVLLWGNGPGFDNSILREAYVQNELSAPWRYSGDRDCRTMVDIAPGAPFQTARVGTHHNALDDAVYQAYVIMHAFKILRGEQT